MGGISIEFPDRVTVELVPSAELAKVRAELLAVDRRSLERYDAVRKLYIELLDLCRELKNIWRFNYVCDCFASERWFYCE